MKRFQIGLKLLHIFREMIGAGNGIATKRPRGSHVSPRRTTEPEIDFDQGTQLTNNVVEAMRRANVRRILYASGSGIYGDLGEIEAEVTYAPRPEYGP